MPFNPVDMQMSVPRTQEFSSMQQQAIQRPMQEQTLLEQQALKNTEEQRTQTSSIEQTEKTAIRDQEKENSRNNKKKTLKVMEDKQGQDKEESTIHPFKGHRLDIRL